VQYGSVGSFSGAPAGQPQLSLTLVDPPPEEPFLVPDVGSGFLDLPIFALKIDDGAGASIQGGGAYFQLDGLIVQRPGITRIYGWIDFRAQDVTGSGAPVNSLYTFNAIAGFGLGTPSELVVEETLYFARVANGEVVQVGGPELFELPTPLPGLELGIRATQNSGSDRDLNPLSLEAGLAVTRVNEVSFAPGGVPLLARSRKRCPRRTAAGGISIVGLRPARAALAWARSVQAVHTRWSAEQLCQSWQGN